MAVLQQQTSNGGGSLFDTPPTRDPLPPAGTFRAVIADIVDKFGVTRPKYDNPNETETVDLTQFRFRYKAKGADVTIDSRKMKISSNEKSALIAMLTSILGSAPRMGWDYAELKGRACLITVAHEEGKTVRFACIVSVSPLPEEDAPAAPARRSQSDIPF